MTHLSNYHIENFESPIFNKKKHSIAYKYIYVYIHKIYIQVRFIYLQLKKQINVQSSKYRINLIAVNSILSVVAMSHVLLSNIFALE